MRKIKSKFIYLTALLLLFAGCDDKEHSYSDLTISYGSSFGFCAGYCYREISMNEGKVSFLKSGRDSVTKVCSKITSDQDWKQLVKSIDYTKFAELDTIVGCPDCADGGAEWVEIKSGNRKHRVVFEYSHAPQATKHYIAALRNELKSFENCK